MHVNSDPLHCIKVIGEGATPWERDLESKVCGYWGPEGRTLTLLPRSPEIVMGDENLGA